MPDYHVQISHDISISFSSEQPVDHQERALVAVQTLMDYAATYTSSGHGVIRLSSRLLRFRYRLVAGRVLARGELYNQAIHYFRGERGRAFEPEIADYAVEKLIEALSRGPR